MKRLAVAAAVVLLTAGIAAAQYKNPSPSPKTPPSATGPGSIQVAPTAGPGTIQITPAQTDTIAIANELSKARRITRDQATLLVRQKKAVYIDVRSKDSYDLGHIPGAISIPDNELLTRLKDLPVKKFLITYCA